MSKQGTIGKMRYITLTVVQKLGIMSRFESGER
jgi:hypothetical protein